MANSESKLEWCIIRLGSDGLWWIEEITDEISWNTENLGVLDPRQVAHLDELLEPLGVYGLKEELISEAFSGFKIEKQLNEHCLRLIGAPVGLMDHDEGTFMLPHAPNEESGPYIEFIDHITRLRVKLLNDTIEFAEDMTTDELEESIRDHRQNDFLEGLQTHVFNDISDILEYVPFGYELDDEKPTEPSDENLLDLGHEPSETDAALQEVFKDGINRKKSKARRQKSKPSGQKSKPSKAAMAAKTAKTPPAPPTKASKAKPKAAKASPKPKTAKASQKPMAQKTAKGKSAQKKIVKKAIVKKAAAKAPRKKSPAKKAIAKAPRKKTLAKKSPAKKSVRKTAAKKTQRSK